MKIGIILWTRPEIIKLYSIIDYLQKQNKIDWFLIHSNQHYDKNMDEIFFKELWLKKAKYNLNIWSWSHWHMTWNMIIKIEDILKIEKPDRILVQWDTNTVIAWWLTASKLNIKVWHVEAWLRSYDRAMPEEINRIVVDHISDWLFCPTMKQMEILKTEWINEKKILISGNTIVDAVLNIKEKIDIYWNNIIDKYGLLKDDYILVTSHRPSNVDNKESLINIINAIKEIWKNSNKKIIWPMHPRTKNNIKNYNLMEMLNNIIVIEPVWFIENIYLQINSHIIITDSWWIQEESCILKKKTLILRENTERPETLEVGGSILVWNNYEKIIYWYNLLINKNVKRYNPFWDWYAYEKIINFIKNNN